MESSLREITMEELVKNDGVNGDLWVLIHNKIYDMTKFKHPGGKEILMDPIGEDRGDDFDSIHSPAVKDEMKKYLIGRLKVVEKQGKTDKKTDDIVKPKSDQTSIGTIIAAVFLLIVALVLYVLNLIMF
jgi:cytochrome b involved in lipid metabolism